MPLESLSQPFNPDEPGRKLREVQIENEPEPRDTAQALWKSISDPDHSLFRNPKTGYWKERMEMEHATLDEKDFGCHEATLLLYVRMQIEGYIPTASDREVIKEVSTISVFEESSLGEASLLLNIYMLQKIDPIEGKKAYERLHNVAARQRGERFLKSIFEKGNSVADVECRLLRLFIENQIDPAKARENTKKVLENTAYFNPQNNRWNSWYQFKEAPDGTTLYVENAQAFIESNVQLWGILVLAEVDPREALHRYEELKASMQYDSTMNLWNDCTPPRDQPMHTLEPQLLEILVLDALEKKGVLAKPLQQNKEITPPEERNF